MMINSTRKSILTISLTRHLTGKPLETVLEDLWGKAPQQASDRFNNVGFNLDPGNRATNLQQLRKELQSREWDGILLAWCVRGHAEFTVLFEDVINMVFEEVREKPCTKLLFNTGPGDLVGATLRKFPEE